MNEFKKFVGEIELDESYFGRKRIRGFHGNRNGDEERLATSIRSLFERNGRVYTEIIPDCKKRTLRPIIQGK